MARTEARGVPLPVSLVALGDDVVTRGVSTVSAVVLVLAVPLVVSMQGLAVMEKKEREDEDGDGDDEEDEEKLVVEDSNST